MIRRHTKKAFLTGLAALLPATLTIILIVKAYQFIADTIGASITFFVVQVLALALQRDNDVIAEYVPSAVGVFIALMLVLVIGLLLASFIGRRTWAFFEARVVAMPLIRAIYPSVKQFTDFFFKKNAIEFKRVVLVEYPRKGMYCLGFITGKAFRTVAAREPREMVSVFVPSTPTPFTGYSIQLPTDELIELDVTVDAALRYIISAGVIVPESEALDLPVAKASPEAALPPIGPVEPEANAAG